MGVDSGDEGVGRKRTVGAISHGGSHLLMINWLLLFMKASKEERVTSKFELR